MVMKCLAEHGRGLHPNPKFLVMAQTFSDLSNLCLHLTCAVRALYQKRPDNCLMTVLLTMYLPLPDDYLNWAR